MKSKISLAFVLIVCSLLLFVLLTRKVSAQHPTPKPTPTPTPAASDVPVPPVVANPCCGTKPPLKDAPGYSSIYSTFTGQVAVATQQTANIANSAQTAVVIWDLTNENQPGVPIGNLWSSSSNPATHMYSHPLWKTTTIGDVFGLTLDDKGNIYVASTRIYGSNNLPGNVGGGSLGPGGHGDIYRLDANTGAPTRFMQTDASLNHYTGNSTKVPNTGPGLGNIHYSCYHRTLYATNFEDGMIYAIDPTGPSGTIKSLWDHGQNLPNAILPAGMPPRTAIADTQTDGFAALGRRTWAVQTYNGRLYYSVWSEDQGRPSATLANEIWSVGLVGSGNFSGPAQLEVSVPPLEGQYSNPVSDISFDSLGHMLLAERCMANDISSAAHKARALEYTLIGSTWTQSSPGKYRVGLLPTPPTNTETNSAGGCDYDWSQPNRMWVTGDALHFIAADLIYGLQGTPITGGGQNNSILIDLDGDVSGLNKYFIGDVEIPCPPASPTPTPESCSAVAKEITCKKGGSGYSLNLVVTNNTGQPVIDVLLAAPPGSNYTVAPAHAGPLANQASINVPVTITGGKPGDKVCFTVTFMGKDGCLCTIEVCTVLPDCCATLNSDATKIVCNKDGTYTYTTILTNNSGSPIQFIYLYPQAGATMTPDHFILTQPLLPGKTFTLSTTIGGIKSGGFCFDISLHTEGMKNCCTSPKHCITLLECK